MRVFIAYAYRPEDIWIEEIIFPLVEAFGSEPVHGKVLGGEELPASIKNLIASCDALIGFATKRDKLENSGWTTHPWVRDELNYSIDQKKHVLEVREDVVPELSGMAGRDRQYVPYNSSKPLECVVGVMQTLGLWHRRSTERFQLLPDADVRPHLDKPCTYRVKDAGGPITQAEAAIDDFEGGLFINVPNLARTSMLQVEITTKKGILSCPYTSMHTFALRLKWKD